MQHSLPLLALLFLTPLYASGDFVPGRVRANAEANLQVKAVNGRYQNTEAVHAFRWETDGIGHTAFTLSLNGQAPLRFSIKKISTMRCGRRFVAETRDGGRLSVLDVSEIQPALCRERGPSLWQMEIKTTENIRESSHLQASGEPEFFLLTQ